MDSNSLVAYSVPKIQFFVGRIWVKGRVLHSGYGNCCGCVNIVENHCQNQLMRPQLWLRC
jgi:hypothetical protein